MDVEHAREPRQQEEANCNWVGGIVCDQQGRAESLVVTQDGEHSLPDFVIVGVL